MGKRGPKPSRPPCPTCGHPPICNKSPWYRCECGRFRLVDGELRPVSKQGKRIKPEPGRVVTKKTQRGPVAQAQKPMEWWETELLNGWVPEGES